LIKKLLAITIFFLFLGINITPSTGNISIVSSECKFNNPPYEPSNPIPPIGAILSICPHNLSWTGGDPDGDDVTYDVYFGSTNPPPLVASNVSGYTTGILGFNKTYYWMVVAWDEHGASTPGPIWSFTTEENLPPCPPSQPFPEDGAPDVPIENVTLCWVGCDPNECDTLRYDLYFDDVNPPLVQRLYMSYENCSEFPFSLPKYKTYYWRVDTYDKMGEFTEGYVWSFTTGDNHPPSKPLIDGPTHGKVGVEYTYTFNSTDEDGHSFRFYVNWGDGTEEITDIYPNATIATLSHSWDTQGTYTIKAKAIDIHDAESEWGELQVTMPRNRMLDTSLFLKYLDNSSFIQHLFNVLRWYS
jgi:hypothetical protein